MAGPRFAFSRTGSLIYVPGTSTEIDERLHWLDARGQLEPCRFRRSRSAASTLHPTSQRLAMTVESDSGADLWLGDMQRGAISRLSADGRSVSPAWRPNGLEIAFAYSKAGPSICSCDPTDADRAPSRCSKAHGTSSRRRGPLTAANWRLPSFIHSPAPMSGCSISPAASVAPSCVRCSTNRMRAFRPTDAGSRTCRTSRAVGKCSCGRRRRGLVCKCRRRRRVAVLVGRWAHALLHATAAPRRSPSAHADTARVGAIDDVWPRRSAARRRPRFLFAS